jgi:hypothetical protein
MAMWAVNLFHIKLSNKQQGLVLFGNVLLLNTKQCAYFGFSKQSALPKRNVVTELSM